MKDRDIPIAVRVFSILNKQRRVWGAYPMMRLDLTVEHRHPRIVARRAVAEILRDPVRPCRPQTDRSVK